MMGGMEKFLVALIAPDGRRLARTVLAWNEHDASTMCVGLRLDLG